MSTRTYTPNQQTPYQQGPGPSRFRTGAVVIGVAAVVAIFGAGDDPDPFAFQLGRGHGRHADLDVCPGHPHHADPARHPPAKPSAAVMKLQQAPIPSTNGRRPGPCFPAFGRFHRTGPAVDSGLSYHRGGPS
jgi:hypothetical protein